MRASSMECKAENPDEFANGNLTRIEKIARGKRSLTVSQFFIQIYQTKAATTFII
jgi:hypothetical protein